MQIFFSICKKNYKIRKTGIRNTLFYSQKKTVSRSVRAVGFNTYFEEF